MINSLKKLNHIRKQLEIAKKTVVKVGLPKDVGFYKDGTSVLVVGAIHEYGIGVPRRSFLRVPFIKEKKVMDKALKSGFKNVFNGGDTLVNLNKVGLIAQNISKTAFKNQGYGEWEDIQQSTKDRKGSSKILFDTGRLVQSVTYWVAKV